MAAAVEWKKFPASDYGSQLGSQAQNVYTLARLIHWAPVLYDFPELPPMFQQVRVLFGSPQHLVANGPALCQAFLLTTHELPRALLTAVLSELGRSPVEGGPQSTLASLATLAASYLPPPDQASFTAAFSQIHQLAANGLGSLAYPLDALTFLQAALNNIQLACNITAQVIVEGRARMALRNGNPQPGAFSIFARGGRMSSHSEASFDHVFASRRANGPIITPPPTPELCEKEPEALATCVDDADDLCLPSFLMSEINVSSPAPIKAPTKFVSRSPFCEFSPFNTFRLISVDDIAEDFSNLGFEGSRSRRLSSVSADGQIESSYRQVSSPFPAPLESDELSLHSTPSMKSDSDSPLSPNYAPVHLHLSKTQKPYDKRDKPVPYKAKATVTKDGAKAVRKCDQGKALATSNLAIKVSTGVASASTGSAEKRAVATAVEGWQVVGRKDKAQPVVELEWLECPPPFRCMMCADMDSTGKCVRPGAHCYYAHSDEELAKWKGLFAPTKRCYGDKRCKGTKGKPCLFSHTVQDQHAAVKAYNNAVAAAKAKY